MRTEQQHRDLDTLAEERSRRVAEYRTKALHIEPAHRHDGTDSWLVMEFQRILAVATTLEQAELLARASAFQAELRAFS